MSARRATLALLVVLGTLAPAHAQSELFATMRARLEEGRYDLAAQAIGPQLVEAHRDNAEAYYLYAHALYLLGLADEARAQLDEALERNGEEMRYRWLEALLDADSGHPERAQESLNALYVANPSYALAMDWGRVAWQAGDFESAIRAFGEAQASAEGGLQPWPYLNHARLLAYMGRFDEAIGILQTVIDVIVAGEDEGADEAALPHPAYVEAFYLLGEVYEAQGLREDARATYFAALSADPVHQPSRLALNRLEDEDP